MRLFQFLIVKNFMVAGLPLCEQSASLNDYLRDTAFIPRSQCDAFDRDLAASGYYPSAWGVAASGPSRASQSPTIEVAPPKANEVKERPSTGKQPAIGICFLGICPRGKKWTNYMSIDSNDGTGDHERFM